MYPVRSIRNLSSSAVFAASPGRTKSLRRRLRSSAGVLLAIGFALARDGASTRRRPNASKSKATADRNSVPSSSVTSSLGKLAGRPLDSRRDAGATFGPVLALFASARRRFPPAWRARLRSAHGNSQGRKARGGSNCSLQSPRRSPPTATTPFPAQAAPSSSIVVLPMPRTGVLITRSRETESSGFWMTFKYEIMSLISARS